MSYYIHPSLPVGSYIAISQRRRVTLTTKTHHSDPSIYDSSTRTEGQLKEVFDTLRKILEDLKEKKREQLSSQCFYKEKENAKKNTKHYFGGNSLNYSLILALMGVFETNSSEKDQILLFLKVLLKIAFDKTREL